jgi:hypothetical protein
VHPNQHATELIDNSRSPNSTDTRFDRSWEVQVTAGQASKTTATNITTVKIKLSDYLELH